MQIFFSTEFIRAQARRLYIIYKRAQVFLGEIDKKDRKGSPITPIPLGRQKGGSRCLRLPPLWFF